MSRETWYLTPRDPLVIGDRRGPVPFVVRKTHPLPLPGTVAGMVRASFVQDRQGVSPEEARELLSIRVGAPWLVRFADPSRGAQGGGADHLLFAPADAAEEIMDPAVADEPAPRLHRGKVYRLGSAEGILWPPGLSVSASFRSSPGASEGRTKAAATGAAVLAP